MSGVRPLPRAAERCAIIESVTPRMHIVTAGPRADAKTSYADREADTAFGEVETKRARADGLAKVEWHARYSPEAVQPAFGFERLCRFQPPGPSPPQGLQPSTGFGPTCNWTYINLSPPGAPPLSCSHLVY